MATKPSITLNYSDGWVNLNTTSAITAETAFFVQNNGNHFIWASESPTEPTGTNTSFILYPSKDSGTALTVSSTAETLWVFNPRQATPITLSVGE
jgi:hypothetical protein